MKGNRHLVLPLILILLSSVPSFAIVDVPSINQISPHTPEFILQDHQHDQHGSAQSSSSLLLRRRGSDPDPLSQQRIKATSNIRTAFQTAKDQNIDPITAQASALRAIGDSITKVPVSHFIPHIQTITLSHDNGADNAKMLQEFLDRHSGETTKQLLVEAAQEKSKEFQTESARLREQFGKPASSSQSQKGIQRIRDKYTVLQGMLLVRDGTDLDDEGVANSLKAIARRDAQDHSFYSRPESKLFKSLVSSLRETAGDKL